MTLVRPNIRNGSQADVTPLIWDVRSSPERGHSCWNPRCAKSRYCAVSFDQLVGEPEQLRWDCDAECFSRFEIDDERKLTRLFDR
jgi:hypothetical protein